MNARTPITPHDVLKVRKAYLHFRILNGRHWVLLCNPSVLANVRNSVPRRSALTCPLCYTIFQQQDADNTQMEVFKKFNDYGKPMK